MAPHDQMTEDEAIEATIRYLESRLEPASPDRIRPDEHERNAPAVDMLVEFGDTVIAIEHTRIESYPYQIRDQRTGGRFEHMLRSRLEDRLPPDSDVELMVPHGNVPTGKQTQNRLADELGERVPDVVACLEIGSPQSAPRHRETIEIDSWKATIYRWPSRGKGFRIVIGSPEDEGQRRERIRQALEDKTEKLDKENRADIRVLVLQSDDVTLGNPFTIHEVLCGLLESGEWHVPDFVCLIEDSVEIWTLVEESCIGFSQLQPQSIPVTTP